ncbi:PREDICTED: MATE efflux family protein 5-like isoform X1 [Populus euphratica]|uniref:Protein DETOXIFICATION n=1 Tax=Populus euphratica TaxID=75702 RepID=A0AAJ6XJX9_POPEU|nr:PREDICTED: MATE efflux family protein 5-like isoform X1 [Populus euphratica]
MMDHALLHKTEERASLLTWGAFVEELKKMSSLAAPLMLVAMTLYLLQVISMMMAGHLSALSLSGVSIATSFTNVTGFSLVIGLAGGLETLCGQAYGAEQYKKFGSYTYGAMISLIPICLPISVLWIFMDRILITIGIDSDISIVARKYAICLVPALFANAILIPLLRYFQCQSMVLPMLLSNCATACIHIPLCWALVYKWELGYIGAALAIGLSCWLNVFFLALYMAFSSCCEKTRGLYLDDIFSSIKEFLHIAFPSAAMVCLEWWTFELLLLLAGLLPDSKLETSVLSVCLTTVSLHYYVQYGISAAGSTRVSNELGAGNPETARGVVYVSLILSATEAVIVSTALFFCRHIFGYAFSNDKGVVDYVAELAPLLCLSIIMDSFQIVLSGIVRGCGWQHIGAFVNLGAYDLVAAPIAVLLCFVAHLRAKGLWIGILTGTTVQATSYVVITALINWQKQVLASIPLLHIFLFQLRLPHPGNLFSYNNAVF